MQSDNKLFPSGVMNNNQLRYDFQLVAFPSSAPIIFSPFDQQPSKFTDHSAIPPNLPKPSTSDMRKIYSDKNILISNQFKSNTDQIKPKPAQNLFTIEENIYSRKNINLLSPRPPKYKSPPQRISIINDFEPLQRVREKKVIFTDNLIKLDNGSSKRQSLSTRSIIRKISTNSNQDNMSNSSRSISVQNSFVSQFRTPLKRERPKEDNNKLKYTQIMSHLQKNNRDSRSSSKFSRQTKQRKLIKEEKYSDMIFPPVYSSLFLVNVQKDSHKIGSELKWKRLCQIFDDKNSVLLNKQGISSISMRLDNQSYANEFMVVAFNAIKHSNCVLQRIFEEQAFNQYGLYLVRIFQQQNWKSIILDEYIPVKQKINESKISVFSPAFINVCSNQSQIELWPYLLEKAFAYYYSAYQLLRFGNTIDFINQLMGLVPVVINLKKKNEKQYTNLQCCLQSVDSFAIGESTESNKQYIIRINYNTEGSYLVFQQSPLFETKPMTLTLFYKIKLIYLYSPKIFHTLSTATIGKYSPSHQNQERSEYSLRKLIVLQNTDCLISIQQKQSRFFVKSSLNYDYIWVRMILVQREFDGYRWIQGMYSNSKSITINVSLKSGQYYLVILPQWRQKQNFQLTLLIWGNHHIAIQKEKGNHCQEMIEQACMDLAQRNGKIKQLSATLCSYNYICPKTGLIIENINNEKLKEDVTVHRMISGIPCSVKILPVNRDFWIQKGRMRQQITISIPKLSSYTIVLRMRGGFDKKLIKLFLNQKQARDKEGK